MKRLICSAAVCAVLLYAGGCGKKENTGGIEERFTVKKVNLRDVISQTGEVTPVVKVELKSEASGKIEKIYVKDGQRVKKGQKILEIDPYKLNTRKKKIDLSLRRTQIEMELAQRNFDEAQELSQTGTVSDNTLQDLQSQLELKEIAYKQQLLEMEDIQYQLRQTTVTSPMDGVITELKVEEGEIAVSATSGFQSGTAIATIADIAQLEVVTKIGEVDYVHLKKGQEVVIRPEAIEKVHTTGKIDFIALNAKRANANELGTFEVRISIDSLIPGLAPGINVSAEFVILDKKGVLGVPCHYVKKKGDKATVMLVGGGGPPDRPSGKKPQEGLSEEERKKRREMMKKRRAEKEKKGAKADPDAPRPRRIEIGATDYKHYEVKSGLKEGDVVVFKLEPKKSTKKPGGKGGGKR